jgi:hypothetical protein
VVTSRLRRLLPPLWLLGLIAVPVMIAAGWAKESNNDFPLDPSHLWHLAFWIFPLGDPPGSDRAADIWDPLWYIRAYVWFLLLSPLMYAAYRKIGWFAVAAPLVAIAVLDKTGFSLPGTADSAMWDFVTFGACWTAGFTHHDGRLRRTHPAAIFWGALALGAVALYWQHGHQGDQPWDLNDVPESQALWSLAFVLLALRWEPSMTWLPRVRPLDRLVTLLNARAVTIYMWHNLAITAVWPVLSVIALGGVYLDDIGHHLDGPVDLVAALTLTLLAVLAFGWVEDLAAKRRPRLWPTGAPALRRAEARPDEVVPALVGAYPLGGGLDPADAPQLPAGPGLTLGPGLAAGQVVATGPVITGEPGPAAGPAPGDRPDHPTRIDLPDLSDRPTGHASAAAAMHRESFRRQAPRSVPWAADLPAIEGGPAAGHDSTGAIGRGDGPGSIDPAGETTAYGPAGDNGASRPVSGGRHAVAETLDLAMPPSEWPPARPRGRDGVPDWFRQQRDGSADHHPE